MLELRDITLRHDGRTILDGISLTMPAGRCVALTGPSGSGKSTLLKIALLFLLPDSGQVLWQDRPVTTTDLAVYRRNFLYIGQKPLPFDGTVEEYLNLPFAFASNRGRQPDIRRQDELLQAFNLKPEMRSQTYARLSGGEQQRMTIIQGLQLNRPFCLLDEITSSLDEETREQVIATFAADTERTILAVTHTRAWMEHGFTEVHLRNGHLEELS